MSEAKLTVVGKADVATKVEAEVSERQAKAAAALAALRKDLGQEPAETETEEPYVENPEERLDTLVALLREHAEKELDQYGQPNEVVIERTTAMFDAAQLLEDIKDEGTMLALRLQCAMQACSGMLDPVIRQNFEAQRKAATIGG